MTDVIKILKETLTKLSSNLFLKGSMSHFCSTHAILCTGKFKSVMAKKINNMLVYVF